MNPRRTPSLATGMALLGLLTIVAPAFPRGNKAKLRIHVSPKQAYLFVDGAALKQGNCDLLRMCTVWLDPGEHTISVHNYGYKTETQKVDLQAGKVKTLDVKLVPEGAPVSPPWGRIQIEGAPPHAAVLLNGKTPAFFVGHVDEFDNNFLFKQQLIVPPGTYQMDITWWGNEIWAGPVTVKPDERVIVHVNKNGATTTKPWPKGAKLTSLPRFKAGINTTTVAVAPVTGQFSANPTQVKCGESSQLSWSSANAVENEISSIGKVGASGNQTVEPKQTTTYDFTAAGPGGIVKQNATVNVDSAIQASLTISPSEVRYHKVGNKVVEQGSATISWSTTNAQSVSIDPIGSVETSGSKTITPTPKQTGYGPVDETDTYTLHATNECGGSQTETATLHIVGLIERAHVKVALASIFFPTDWPDRRHPHDGLLRSQKDTLDKLAETFIQHHEAEPDSRLLLEAHADRRGPREFNILLSARRGQIVKDYLVSKGVPADLIEIKAYGWTKPISLSEVKKLESENPYRTTAIRHWETDWLANNRRVDPVLEPNNLRPTPYYPHNASDAKVLHMRNKPSLRLVRKYE
ncbi:MAG: OmpA family protein [Acidobacteria bacterium]|nr:OmpA family protein [Acidobacteriota bacterium]